MDLIAQLAVSFLSIFLIMDPFASIAPFIALTSKCKYEETRYVATKAVIIAGAIALVFMLGGAAILSFMSITINDLKVAGGIIIGLLGLQSLLGFSFNNNEGSKQDNMAAVAVVIATPLLSGPGLISALLLLTTESGFLVALFSLVLSLIVTWLILVNASKIKKVGGQSMINFLSKIIGMMLIAMAISFIRSGWTG